MGNNSLFSTSMDVRISDINHGNHLDFARLIQMIGNARALMFKKYNVSDICENGVGIIMRNLEIKYKGQAYFNDQLCFDISCNEPTERSVLVNTAVFNDTLGKPVADCTYKLSFFDYNTQQLSKITDEYQNLFQKQDPL